MDILSWLEDRLGLAHHHDTTAIGDSGAGVAGPPLSHTVMRAVAPPATYDYGSNQQFVEGLDAQMGEAAGIYHQAMAGLAGSPHYPAPGAAERDPYYAADQRLEGAAYQQGVQNSVDGWQQELSTDNATHQLIQDSDQAITDAQSTTDWA